MYQTNVFYTLNLHSVICQIHFNKVTLKLKIHEIELQPARCERGKDKELYYKVGTAMNKIHQSRVEKPLVTPSKERDGQRRIQRRGHICVGY